jgi:hypothetical protein
MDITQFPELQYIRKNRLLPEQFRKVFFPNEQEKKMLTKYILFFEAVISNNWKLVDLFLKQEYCNIDDYRNIFALLFKFHYSCSLIDVKQFQTALQIQQVRSHPFICEKSEYYRKLYCQETKFFLIAKKGRIFKNPKMTEEKKEKEIELLDRLLSDISLVYDSYELIYFDDLDEKTRIGIVDLIVQKWSKNCIFKNPQNWKDFCRTKIMNKLDKSIWYKTLKPSQFNYTIDSQSRYYYFPIPETLNFSSFLYTYEPQLVAGLLKSSTLLNHIYKYKKRPFALFHPDIQSSFVTGTSDHFFPIENHWLHDFTHMSYDFSPDILSKAEIQKIIHEKDERKSLSVHDLGMLLHPLSQWRHR